MSEPQKQVGGGRLKANILKNVTSNWMALSTNILLSFFMAPFIVRSLGNVYYGIWVLLSQFTGYLWLFDFGVRESVIKYVAQYQANERYEELGATVNAALFLYSGIASLTLLATVAMSLALPYLFNIPTESVTDARWTLLCTGASVAQGFVFNVFVGVLMGLQRWYLVSRMGVLFSLVRAALIVIALSAGHRIVALAAIQLTVSTVGNLMVLWLAWRSLPEYKPRLVLPRREEITKVFGYSKYVLGNNIGEKVVFGTDGVVIGAFLPIATLTYYSIAGSLAGYLRMFMVTMAAVLNPVSSALEAKQDTERLATLFFQASKTSVILGLPVCIGFIILGSRFIGLWMGPSFALISGRVLVILAIATLFGLPHYCISMVLYGLGRHRIMAQWRAVEAVMNIVLSVTLVQSLGLIGVALGTLCPHVLIAAGVLPYKMAGVMNFRLRNYYVSIYGRPFLASLPFAGACYVIDTMVSPGSLVTFFPSVAMALAVYVTPCWFLALSAVERRAILARVKIPFRWRWSQESAGSPPDMR